ncbi:hypothetical protein BN7_3843 [Wickerhamomyces ciferrii]|uniref:Uncharacterized protein n=1 Tax=Wickerhamomyces ciferrii (strain ATCC 14091 / BCRC 22168 / CBS 111 / JCM 3599 / NBRC 0793 / NRRL Y-1031 F-60-10) TaxID=1206466 RepID=K0KMW5_WICCF|nr:uncharacterized protein BN7_3843 [Wickerhamomyces ciferrii]CCH44281.1 hypothetical protein BN7_3843 [Wickerhamomyces ciferrii]
MSLNEPSVDFHLKLQEGSFKVPYEAIRKNFKNVQKLDERQFKKIDELFKDFNQTNDKKLKLTKLKQIITNLKQFEKKIQSKTKIENELISRIQARLNKLNELNDLKNQSQESPSPITQDKLLNWYRDQTNLLIADYLLKNSHLIESNPGLKLIKNLNFEKLIDFDIILVSNKISTSILNQDLSNLVNWIDDNKSYLRKIKSNLEFQTRFQQYIELIKQGDLINAIKLFQNHLSFFTQTNFNEIKSASGLLIFASKASKTQDPNFQKYNSLLSPKRYEYLSNLFLEIYYKLHGISKDDPLLIYLSLGISSLKTRSCKCPSPSTQPQSFESILNKKLSQSHPTTTTNNCPVCSLEFNQLSYQLPYSHNVKSYLFENPVMLPNGNIYDREKLLNYSKNLTILSEMEVKDPMSTEVFELDELIRMYPT